MAFSAVIIWTHQLALLIGAECRVQFADQLLRRLWLRLGGPYLARAYGGECRGRADRPEKIAPALHLWQIKSFIALWAIVLGFIEHRVFSGKRIREGSTNRRAAPAAGNWL